MYGGKGPVVFVRSVVRGHAIIGENCKIGPSAYIGPYTAIEDRRHVTVATVDDSMVMDDATLDVEGKIVRSMIGKGSKILSSDGQQPKGEGLIVGAKTTIMF